MGYLKRKKLAKTDSSLNPTGSEDGLKWLAHAATFMNKKLENKQGNGRRISPTSVENFPDFTKHRVHYLNPDEKAWIDKIVNEKLQYYKVADKPVIVGRPSKTDFYLEHVTNSSKTQVDKICKQIKNIFNQFYINDNQKKRHTQAVLALVPVEGLVRLTVEYNNLGRLRKIEGYQELLTLQKRGL